MIFVTDKGRLCNNILQYGHLYAWGREHGRSTMSMRFAYKYPEFHISHTRYHHFVVYVAAKLAARWGLMPTVDFNDINSDYASEQQVLLQHRHVLACGWCVRFPDLFEKYLDEIRQLFAFNKATQQAAARVLAAHDGGGMRLGVHVRRGDYARWCGGRYYYDDRQYADVIDRFLQLHEGERVTVYVCGNDPQMDRDYYYGRFGRDRVCFAEGSAAEDLCLLSHCQYLIGPPSTFSLVATMYGDNRLYWMVEPDAALQPSSFQPFKVLFRQFDSLFVPS